jgi:hypothetical protein
LPLVGEPAHAAEGVGAFEVAAELEAGRHAATQPADGQAAPTGEGQPLDHCRCRWSVGRGSQPLSVPHWAVQPTKVPLALAEVGGAVGGAGCRAARPRRRRGWCPRPWWWAGTRSPRGSRARWCTRGCSGRGWWCRRSNSSGRSCWTTRGSGRRCRRARSGPRSSRRGRRRTPCLRRSRRRTWRCTGGCRALRPRRARGSSRRTYTPRQSRRGRGRRRGRACPGRWAGRRRCRWGEAGPCRRAVDCPCRWGAAGPCRRGGIPRPWAVDCPCRWGQCPCRWGQCPCRGSACPGRRGARRRGGCPTGSGR